MNTTAPAPGAKESPAASKRSTFKRQSEKNPPRPSHNPTSAATCYTLIETAKLNGIDPQAWLADVLARLADPPVRRIDELLPCNWTQSRLYQIAA